MMFSDIKKPPVSLLKGGRRFVALRPHFPCGIPPYKAAGWRGVSPLKCWVNGSVIKSKSQSQAINRAHMGRHRGIYKPERNEPYELSRGRLEAFINCEACFWLDRVKGVKFPSIPGFLLNTNTDTLLKKDLDQFRGNGPHPIMSAAGLSQLRPFSHEDIGRWESSLHFGSSPNHFNTMHEETNILFGGGIDDIWENVESGELHIVDYKSTAQMGAHPTPLDETFIAPPEDPIKVDYKAGYRRQMEMYQWILRRKGFSVSDTGYFLYVDGQHKNEAGMIDPNDPSQAWMRFNTAIIPFVGDDSWVEAALSRAKITLEKDYCPEHAVNCEHGKFIEQVRSALNFRP